MNATPPDPPVLEALRSRVAARIQVARPRPAAPGTGRVVDHGPWERLLADTTDGWQVDYGALRAGRPALTDYLEALGSANPDALAEEEQLAFWINAYNAAIVSLVADHRPPVSVLEVPGAFTRRQFRIGGRGLTADQIEHGIVRRLGDHRVHFGLNCASIGCPPLRAYDGAGVREQLEANGRRYLADPRRGARADGGRLRLSMVFRWFAGDFAPLSGPAAPLAGALGLLRPQRVLPVARRYLPPALRDLGRLGFIDWDWSLNGLRSGDD